MSDLTVLRTSITLGLLLPAAFGHGGVPDLTGDDAGLADLGVCRCVSYAGRPVAAATAERASGGQAVSAFVATGLTDAAVALRRESLRAARQGCRQWVDLAGEWASTGRAALAAAWEREPDVVVTRVDPWTAGMHAIDSLADRLAAGGRDVGIRYRDLTTTASREAIVELRRRFGHARSEQPAVLASRPRAGRQ
ncbi:MAG: hypothetical protein AAF532_05765 [Planctomycetota bacterium]